MGVKYRPLPAHPGEMDGESLRAHLAGLKDSEIMRSLLLAEIEAIRAGARRERRTMRHLWYNLIKPALSRAGLLHQKTRGGKPVEWDNKLSVYLAELVRAGATSYEELSIVDGSRQRQPATAITSPVASVRLVGAHYPWLILFTEKDTIWGEVQALASLYGVSAISGKGQPSNACTENTVKAILQSPAYCDGQPLLLLSLTDYDPAGYDIANAQFTQVQEVASLAGCRVYHERLGLTPEQLTPEEVAANAYEPSDAGLVRWLAETGGIDGEPLGLELDALEIPQLRAMFADGIERYVDLAPRRADLQDALLDLIACELLLPGFNTERQRLIATVKAGPVWGQVKGTAISGDLFRRAAVAGLDAIDPLELELFSCADNVRRAMANGA